jgi:hypothetical protein
MRPNGYTLARIGDRQHGRITCAQLHAAGVDASRIKRWAADGRLRRVHRGIYALGHAAPSLAADYMGAVLAGGRGAVLSHAPAAHMAKLRRGRPPAPEITIPLPASRRRPGITIHRAALHPYDVTEIDGIPTTCVPRILLDLAPHLSPAELARACHEAWVHHRTRPHHVEACIARNPHKPGIARLRAALGADVTLSALEAAFLRLLAAHRLARPRTNVDVAGDKVDCHWPALGLTVELVSYRYHATRDGFETDVARRRRSRHLAFSYGDVVERPDQTAAELAVLLRARS